MLSGLSGAFFDATNPPDNLEDDTMTMTSVLALSSTNNAVFSWHVDGIVRMWSMPNTTRSKSNAMYPTSNSKLNTSEFNNMSSPTAWTDWCLESIIHSK